MKKSVLWLTLAVFLLFVGGYGLIAADDCCPKSSGNGEKAACCSSDTCTCPPDCCKQGECKKGNGPCTCEKCKSGSCAGKAECSHKGGKSCALGKTASQKADAKK